MDLDSRQKPGILHQQRTGMKVGQWSDCLPTQAVGLFQV